MSNVSIADVLQKFVDAPDKIGTIIKEENEFYFTYGSYFFSIIKRDSQREKAEHGSFTIYVYPKWHDSLGELVGKFISGDFEGIDMMYYHENQLQGQNVRLNLAKLYQILAEKHLNLGTVFGDILAM